MKNTFLFIGLILNMGFLFSQDVITINNGEEIKAKVLEVLKEDIKFKKFSNPDGPVYTLQKSEIIEIRYANGDKDVFSRKAQPEISSPQLLALTKKGNKVFIQNGDHNAIIHAKGRLNQWGYWNVVDKFENADIVIKFTLDFYLEYFGYAEIIDAKTNKVIYVTKDFNTLSSLDLNSKKAIIYRILEQDIIPNFNKYQSQ